MKKLLFIPLAFIAFSTSGQDYQRKTFDYAALGDKDTTQCSDHVFEEADRILGMIDNLKSDKAVTAAKALYEKEAKCPTLFEVYAWAMFRSGDWTNACKLIDSAIGIYGTASPDLIMRRGYMNIEMAELGVGVQNIDGNSVYQAKNNQLPYDETNFKKQNFIAALSDLSYIGDTYQGRPQEIYLSGYIYQQLGDYDHSTEYFIRLMGDENYSDRVVFMIVDNIIGQGKYKEAEESLQNLEKRYPRVSLLFKKYADVYEKMGNEEKRREALRKQDFYTWVPEYCDLMYSEENYNLFRYFLGDESGKKKIKRLKELQKKDTSFAIDACITILNMHSNHGNGVEAEARKILAGYGSAAVPKVILLMENAPSTCTVGDAASVLADIKDPRGWQPMVDYLLRMENLPFTIIPPAVPEQIIRFDKEKGLNALLIWLQPQMEEELNGAGQSNNIFKGSTTYDPMGKAYKKEEVEKAAIALQYTDKQRSLLIGRIYGK